jgi:uncharacterized cupredoxin-like copper-binding protein
LTYYRAGATLLGKDVLWNRVEGGSVKQLSVLFLLLGSVVVTACGAGEPAVERGAAADAEIVGEESVREVVITMSEYEFISSETVFTAGVPYRFVFKNEGHEEHEWAVVPRGATDESNLLFEVEEDDLPAGADIIREFTFPEPGEYDFACFLPGHYENGMVLPVRVE